MATFRVAKWDYDWADRMEMMIKANRWMRLNRIVFRAVSYQWCPAEMWARRPSYEGWERLHVRSSVNSVCLFTAITMEMSAIRWWGGASRFSSPLIWRSVCERMIENSTSKMSFSVPSSSPSHPVLMALWETQRLRLYYQLYYIVFVRAAEDSVTYLNFSLEDRGPKPLSITYKVRVKHTSAASLCREHHVSRMR